MCHEKLGNQEAVKNYRHLVNNFPEQTNEVAIAKARLARLIEIANKVTAIAPLPVFTRIQMPVRIEGAKSVESRCGAVALGLACLFPSLSFDGALIALP